eukprot:1492353-Alexandrium_andersonii.AAC.1
MLARRPQAPCCLEAVRLTSLRSRSGEARDRIGDWIGGIGAGHPAGALAELPLWRCPCRARPGILTARGAHMQPALRPRPVIAATRLNPQSGMREIH